MRWYPRSQSEEGQTRRIKRFAFLPTRMSDGQIVWLELYIVEQRRGWEGMSLDMWFGWITTDLQVYNRPT